MLVAGLVAGVLWLVGIGSVVALAVAVAARRELRWGRSSMGRRWLIWTTGLVGMLGLLVALYVVLLLFSSEY